MSEWVLVPVEPTEEMLDREYSPISDWGKMVEARPPTPRSVWDAMVERGARESWNKFADYRGDWDLDVKDDTKVIARHEWEVGFRAALGNPKVEGDDQ